MEYNYEDLINKGFNDKQINQLFILDKYVEIEALLTIGVNPDIDVNILRNFNNYKE